MGRRKAEVRRKSEVGSRKSEERFSNRSHKEPTLSVCMIVKNEEENLPRLLSSIRNLADEVIVVDTGSEDRTVEIAASFGARVYHFPWCDDFSAARNESLRHATKDFIMWLDGDDEILSDQIPTIKSHLKEHRGTGVFMRLRNIQPDGNFESIQLRIFPNRVGACFEGRIHEQIFPCLARRNVGFSQCDGLIVHHGYESSVCSAEKMVRNKRILERTLENDPDDFCAAFFLARTLKGLGENREALTAYDRVIEMGSRDRSLEDLGLYKVAFIDKACMLAAEGGSVEALGLLEKAFALFPGEDLIRFSLGELYFKKGRHRDCHETLLPLRNAQFDKEILPLDVQVLRNNLWRYLGIASLYEGDYINAVACLERLPAPDAEDSSIHQYLALAKEQMGDLEGAAALCREGLSFFPDDGSLRARLFLVHVRRDSFDEALAEYERLNGRSQDMDVIAAMFYLHCRRMNPAQIGHYYGALRGALNLAPSNFPEGFGELAEALEKSGQRRALESYRSSIDFLLNQ